VFFRLTHIAKRFNRVLSGIYPVLISENQKQINIVAVPQAKSGDFLSSIQSDFIAAHKEAGDLPNIKRSYLSDGLVNIVYLKSQL